jgi:hypothetical protein
LREAIIVFFLALSFYFFVRWLKNDKWRDCLLSLIFIFLSSIFHGAIILISLPYIFFFVFYRPKKKKWLLINRRFFAGGLLAIIVFSLFYGYFYNKIPKISEFNLEWVQRYFKGLPVGRTQYLKEMIPKTYFDIVWQTPIRIVYFYLVPFPWNLEKFIDIFGFIDALLCLFLFIFCFKSLNQIRKENKALFIASIFILVVFSFVFAWGTSNSGTALRHRQKIAFLLIIISSLSLSKTNWKKFLPKIK